MNMAVSLVPSLRYGNCRHFCPYLRPRCVWFFVPCTHARTLTACVYARMHSWIDSRDPPRISSLLPLLLSFHPLFQPRVWYVPWYLVPVISRNFVKGARINRTGTPRTPSHTRARAQDPLTCPLPFSSFAPEALRGSFRASEVRGYREVGPRRLSLRTRIQRVQNSTRRSRRTRFSQDYLPTRRRRLPLAP